MLVICCGLPQIRSSAAANQEVAPVIGDNFVIGLRIIRPGRT